MPGNFGGGIVKVKASSHYGTLLGKCELLASRSLYESEGEAFTLRYYRWRFYCRGTSTSRVNTFQVSKITCQSIQ